MQDAADGAAPEPRHLAVQRTARYYTLGGGPDGPPREVWFALHGYGQLAADFARPFRRVAGPDRLVVVPEALQRFYVRHAEGVVGATWMTREDRLTDIDDYVAYLDALRVAVLGGLDGAAPAVHVLGFSQGTATACRWAALGRHRPDRLVCWAGGIPPDLDLAGPGRALAAMDLTLVVGTDDPFVTPERLADERARLDHHGIPHRLLTFGGPHRLDGPTLQQLAR